MTDDERTQFKCNSDIVGTRCDQINSRSIRFRYWLAIENFHDNVHLEHFYLGRTRNDMIITDGPDRIFSHSAAISRPSDLRNFPIASLSTFIGTGVIFGWAWIGTYNYRARFVLQIVGFLK